MRGREGEKLKCESENVAARARAKARVRASDTMIKIMSVTVIVVVLVMVIGIGIVMSIGQNNLSRLDPGLLARAVTGLERVERDTIDWTAVGSNNGSHYWYRKLLTKGTEYCQLQPVLPGLRLGGQSCESMCRLIETWF